METNDYKIIELLCTGESENMELGKQLCASQSWQLKNILKKYGYDKLGISTFQDFLKTTFDCYDEKLLTLPELLPASMKELNCYYNQLSHLPAELPYNLGFIVCGSNPIKNISVLEHRFYLKKLGVWENNSQKYQTNYE